MRSNEDPVQPKLKKKKGWESSKSRPGHFQGSQRLCHIYHSGAHQPPPPPGHRLWTPLTPTPSPGTDMECMGHPPPSNHTVGRSGTPRIPQTCTFYSTFICKFCTEDEVPKRRVWTVSSALSLPPSTLGTGKGYRPPAWFPTSPPTPPKLCNETSLSPPLTLTCQVWGAGSHLATPGLCLRGCQGLPGAGSYGVPVWTVGWGYPPGLEQRCMLAVLVSRFWVPACFRVWSGNWSGPLSYGVPSMAAGSP